MITEMVCVLSEEIAMINRNQHSFTKTKQCPINFIFYSGMFPRKTDQMKLLKKSSFIIILESLSDYLCGQNKKCLLGVVCYMDLKLA